MSCCFECARGRGRVWQNANGRLWLSRVAAASRSCSCPLLTPAIVVLVPPAAARSSPGQPAAHARWQAGISRLWDDGKKMNRRGAGMHVQLVCGPRQAAHTRQWPVRHSCRCTCAQLAAVHPVRLQSLYECAPFFCFSSAGRGGCHDTEVRGACCSLWSCVRIAGGTSRPSGTWQRWSLNRASSSLFNPLLCLLQGPHACHAAPGEPRV